jgi:hypothetical protein
MDQMRSEEKSNIQDLIFISHSQIRSPIADQSRASGLSFAPLQAAKRRGQCVVYASRRVASRTSSIHLPASVRVSTSFDALWPIETRLVDLSMLQEATQRHSETVSRRCGVELLARGLRMQRIAPDYPSAYPLNSTSFDASPHMQS